MNRRSDDRLVFGSTFRALSRSAPRAAVSVLLAAATVAIGIGMYPLPAQAATNLTVTNCNSSGSGSLPDAVATADAATGDSIGFALPPPACSTITLNATLQISSNMTINGPGAALVAVSGANIVEVFSVSAAVTGATISGLTIENGLAATGSTGSGGTSIVPAGNGGNGGNGGAIYNAGTLTVSGTILTGNVAGSGGAGGAGFSVVTGNGGNGANGGNGGNGGAIYNAGTGVLTVSNSTLTNDAAGNASGLGPAGLSGGNGGTASNGSAAGNGGDGGISGNGGSGGGIYNAGTLTVSSTLLSANGAGAGARGGKGGRGALTGTGNGGNGGKSGGGGNGGGIDNVGTLTISNATLSGNTAGDSGIGAAGGIAGAAAPGGAGGDGGNGGSGGAGGGIYNSGTLTVSNTTLSSNAAGGAPGGILTGGAGGGICTGNGGSGGPGGKGGDGGAISNVGMLSLSNATLAGNAAGNGGGGGFGGSTSSCSAPGAYGGGGGGGGSGGNGGGIYNTGTFTVSNATFSGDAAGSGGAGGTGGTAIGGSGITGDGGFGGSGGGIYNDGATATTSASILAGTTASGSANTPDNCADVTSLTDGGFNVEDAASCGFSGAKGSPSGASDSAIGLGALAQNGGPSETEAIGASSAAHYLVPASSGLCPATDQRGVSRPQSSPYACDAGAFEAQPSQSINFTSTAPTATVGGPSYDVTATGGSSGQPVTFSIDAVAAGVCSIGNGDVVSFAAFGSCVIDANQAGGPAGGTNYLAAPQSQQVFSVGQGSQSITVTSPAPSAVFGGPDYTVTASGGGSGNPVTFSLDAGSSGCSLSGADVSFTGVGTCVIDSHQTGNTNYLAAPQVQQAFTVGQAAQAIAFTSTVPSAVFGGPDYTVTASGGGSSNLVTFSLDNGSSGCSLSAADVSFTGVGTCVIDANQAASANYLAAPQVQQSFTVGQGTQAVNFTSTMPASARFGGPDYTVTASGGGSSNLVTFSLDNSSSGCTLSAADVSFGGVGTCVIDASQAGTTEYSAAPQVQQSFSVAQAAQTITFTSPAPSAVFGGLAYTVAAIGGGSGQPVIFSLGGGSPGCSLSGALVHFTGVGRCVINANQAGSTDYSAAPQVQQSFTVAPALTTTNLTLTTVSATYGHEQATTFRVSVGAQFSGNPSGTVMIHSGATTLCDITLSAAIGSCSIAASSPALLAAGTYAVKASYSGSTDFSPSASLATTLTVSKAPTKTGLTLSASSVVHGHEQGLKFTLILGPVFAGVPTGAITVLAGKVKLCSVSITATSHGKGTCSPSPTALSPGSYSVAAQFGGNSNFAPSASSPAKLKVT